MLGSFMSTTTLSNLAAIAVLVIGASVVFRKIGEGSDSGVS